MTTVITATVDRHGNGTERGMRAQVGPIHLSKSWLASASLKLAGTMSLETDALSSELMELLMLLLLLLLENCMSWFHCWQNSFIICVTFPIQLSPWEHW